MLMEFVAGALLVTGIGCTAAVLLTVASRRYASSDNSIVDLVNAELPQTQCAQCGYPGCRPYAEAIVNGEAINKCPPGGDDTITRLANLLGRPAAPLDPSLDNSDPDRVAFIDEEECIGCTLCIRACPVDAIIGAHQMMHTVIESECTGCDLCIEPCPVDCIEMRPVEKLHELPEPAPATEMPCIQCDRCEEVCPRGLKPQLLHWYLDSPERLQRLDVAACIECARCDNVCPSHIPLATRFGNVKQKLEQQAEEARRAARLEHRYLRKQAREQQDTERISKPPAKSDRAALINAVKGEVSH
ncbi:MAG: electron transport complex subunit RsxB [Pseudomonadales bacterium]